jgi:CRISPR-associated protein Cas5d
MKVERVSYDVMTPSAARGILEAIHWKPAIKWVIDVIHVLKAIRFASIRRNELSEKIKPASILSTMKNKQQWPECFIEEARQQRASLVLRDVAYVIEAHFELTEKAGSGDNPGKHLDIFNRRASGGQCFHQPCLGCREFAASFSLFPHEEKMPLSEIKGETDLGWMLYDFDFKGDITPRFFRPKMINGLIDVRKAWEERRDDPASAL